MDVPMAFTVHDHTPPGIEVRVNFGLYAGRKATSAEIYRLAEWLLDEVGAVSIISEERHEFDGTEAEVHQVRIEVAESGIPAGQRETLETRLLERAEHWAHQCVADRHVEV